VSSLITLKKRKEKKNPKLASYFVPCICYENNMYVGFKKLRENPNDY